MLKKFFSLYRHLVLHLLFLWLLLIFSFAAIYGVFAIEKYYMNYLNDQFSQCNVILYVDNNSDPSHFSDQLERINFVDSIKVDHNSQTIQKLEHNFQLYDLKKWLNPDNFPHTLIFNLNGRNFQLIRFKNLLRRLSADDRINKLNFNAEKILQLNRRKQQLNKYKFYPIYMIIFIAIIMVFLITRLMRVKRKKLWRQWRSLEGSSSYKFSHSIIEFILTGIVTFGILLYPNYRWGQEFLGFFYINLLEISPIWYFMGGLFLIYILISWLNLIESYKS